MKLKKNKLYKKLKYTGKEEELNKFDKFMKKEQKKYSQIGQT